MEVKVVDTGQGISAALLPYVFERFRQAEKATSRRYGGLGLGLDIVWQLVKLHGGTVQAAREGEGHGATFTIRLPILTAAAPAERRSAASFDPPQLSSPRLDGLHVLVVDDEADERTLASLVLAEAGARVIAVASVREALRQGLDGQRPDVLVSDIGLPEEDGFVLVRQIREIREYEAAHGGFLPAIALTGFAGAEDRTRVIASGFQAHVSKPFDPAELRASIAAVARGSETAGW